MRPWRMNLLLVSLLATTTLILLIELLRRSGAAGVATGVEIGAGTFTIAVALVAWRAWWGKKKFARQVKEAGEILDRKDYSQALQKCDQALEVARALRFRAGDQIALACVIRSMALQHLGRNQDALAASAQALALVCRVKNGGIQMAILDQAGTMLLETGNSRRAIPMLEAAIKLALQIEHDPRRTFRLQQAGLAYLRVGLHSNSVASFGKAIELLTREKGADWAGLSGMYLNLGNGYKRMEKLDDAERCYRESLRLLEVNGVSSPEQLSQALLNLGVACGEAGRNEESENFYKQALEMRLKVYGRNDWRIGITYNNLANCRWRARDFEGAEEYIRMAAEILESRPESMCHVLGTLARIREDQGRIEEAMAALARARDLI